MPSDLQTDHTFERYTVCDRAGITLPFSKGILATSILATGIETPQAYEVAKAIQDYLYTNHITRIGSDELTELSARQLASMVSTEAAERYLAWRRARRIGRPIIISMLGSSGVGKSTLATRLALRLGINKVVTTDAIREVLRTVIPSSVLPELHISSYEAIETDLSESQASSYHRQARAVVSACAAVAKRYVKEKKNVLLEGVHMMPGYLSKELEGMEEKPIVIELLVALNDEEVHLARLSHRLLAEPGRGGHRHLEKFKIIRELQKNMQSMARAAGIQEFDVGGEEDLTQGIVKAIVDKALD